MSFSTHPPFTLHSSSTEILLETITQGQNGPEKDITNVQP